MRRNRHCVLSMLLAGFASTAVVLAQQATRPATAGEDMDVSAGTSEAEIHTGNTEPDAASEAPRVTIRRDKNVEQFDEGERADPGSLSENQNARTRAGAAERSRTQAGSGRMAWQDAGIEHRARSDNWWSQRYANAEPRDRGPNFDDPALWREQGQTSGQASVSTETDITDRDAGVSSGMVERGTERDREVFEGTDIDMRREHSRTDRGEFRDDRALDDQRMDDQRRFEDRSARQDWSDDRSAQLDNSDYQAWRDGDAREGRGMTDSRYTRDGQAFEGRKHNYGEYRTLYDTHTSAEDYSPWTTHSRDRWDYQTTNETRRPSWSHDYRLVPSRDRELYRGPNQAYRSSGWDDDDRWDADGRDDETGLTWQEQRALRQQSKAGSQ